MNFKPMPGFIHIKRQEKPRIDEDDSVLWKPPETAKTDGLFVVVELISMHPLSDVSYFKNSKKLVVDSRMIESFEINGEKHEFVKEQYVVGFIDG